MTKQSRDAGALALGSALNGLLSYAVFAIVTRGLGAAGAAPVSVLWTYWAFSSAAVTFPLQHWITRTVPAHGEGSVRHALPRLLPVVLALSAGAGAVAALARDPLFHRDDLWFPAMVAAITVGSSAIGMVRGVLSARHRFVSVGTTLVAENALRCLLVGVLFASGSTNVVAYGLSIVAGHLVVFLWPSTARLSHERLSDPTTSPFTFLAGAGLAQLINQVVLTGGPVVLTLAHGTQAQVTALFAALALFRAPYLLTLGVMPQVTSRVTGLVLAGRTDSLRRIRLLVYAGSAVAVGAAAAGAAWIGPELLQLVFGEAVTIGRGPAAVLAAGSTVAVANLVLMVLALAQNRPVGVARAWGVAILAAVLAFLALSGSDPLHRTMWAFLVAETSAFVGLVVVGAADRPRSRRPLR